MGKAADRPCRYSKALQLLRVMGITEDNLMTESGEDRSHSPAPSIPILINNRLYPVICRKTRFPAAMFNPAAV